MTRCSTSVEVAECDHSSLTDLRRWLRHQAPGDHTIDAEMVVTELVDNAIEHGGGPRTVRVSIVDSDVLVEIEDHEPDAILTVGRSRLDPYRGWGLAIVDATSTWGLTRKADRKTVWACIPVGAST